jgi:hypothetical protein
MVGVVVLLVIGLWAVVGRWAWNNFVRPRIPAPRIRLAGFAFAVAWFVLPVGDEILGSFRFRQLCREIPPTRYYGPIAVGPGAFFDQQGNRKWKSSDEFARIVLDSQEWGRLWERRTETKRIASWPMAIFEARSLQIESSTGRVVVESYFRGSGGGWIKRTLGRSVLGTYQCFSAGDHPQDEDAIEFNRGSVPNVRRLP